MVTRRAATPLPLTLNAVSGPFIQTYLAQIYLLNADLDNTVRPPRVHRARRDALTVRARQVHCSHAPPGQFEPQSRRELLRVYV